MRPPQNDSAHGPRPASLLKWGLVALAALAVASASGRSSADDPINTVRLPPIGGPADPLLVAPQAPALKAAPDASLTTKLRQRGDLVLSETTLRQALFTISESWGVNIVVGNDVSGQVNGSFKNAPLHEILHSILYANGYGYRVVGQGLVVMKADTLGDSNPLFETHAIVLQALQPANVVEGANMLKSAQGKVIAIPSARSLMVVDMPERIAVIREFVKEVDDSAAGKTGGDGSTLQRRVMQFTPQFIKVAAVQESLNAVLSKDGKAVAVVSENRVVVVDYPPNLELAAKVVHELDIPRPQVRITAMIYDVSIEDLERFGINWYHAVKGTGTTGVGTPEAMWAVDSLTQVPAGAGATAGTMTFMNLTRNFDVRAVLEALCNSKDSQLLADPSVTVVDREPATIQIVTEIPYQQLTQTQQGGNIGTTAFREAGVQLKVIPHIANDGTVQMEVTPTFSRLTGFTNGQNPQPIIDKREAQTTVRVINQQWLVIGGLRQRTAVKDDRGIPKLSSMKYLGKLFQSYDYSFRESELVVFLMPEMVTPRYAGREREQVDLGASQELLDAMPVAPHVLSREEVGCPWCGKSSCMGCNGSHHLFPQRQKLPEREHVADMSLSQPAPAPVVVAPRTAANDNRGYNNTFHNEIRRLPSVEPEYVASRPPVAIQPPPQAPANLPVRRASPPPLAQPATTSPAPRLAIQPPPASTVKRSEQNSKPTIAAKSTATKAAPTSPKTRPADSARRSVTVAAKPAAPTPAPKSTTGLKDWVWPW